jgi:hypothetical protein
MLLARTSTSGNGQNMKTALRLTIAAFGLAIFNLSAATLLVSLESTNPVAPFATWETAATVIQDAVDAAKAGDTVLVGDGVYKAGGRTNSGWGYAENRVTVTNSIRLESVNGPASTTISGGDGSGRCVFLGTNAVLSGFTLTNGAAESGGGVFCESSAVVTNCTLSGNCGNIGGGASGGTLYNCTLSDNSSLCGVFIIAIGGGAFESTLHNCTLRGNVAIHGGGAAQSTLHNCTLSGNSASHGGGAETCALYNCVLTGNSASDSGGGASGSWQDESVLYNCTLTGNSSLYGGGVYGGSLYNCIVYYNTAPNGPNYFTGSIPNWGAEVSTLLEYSCTTPLPTNGVGNITEPPLFMDMAAGDFRLWEGSPCIDSGTNLIGFVRFDWWTGDPVPYAHDPTDILGNTRFIDGNGDGKAAWDIGAYEFNSFRPPRFAVQPQLTADGWKLNITGAPNKWVYLQRSSNLKDWEDIWSGWMGREGAHQCNDGDMGQKVMFYRAVVR